MTFVLYIMHAHCSTHYKCTFDQSLLIFAVESSSEECQLLEEKHKKELQEKDASCEYKVRRNDKLTIAVEHG